MVLHWSSSSYLYDHVCADNLYMWRWRHCLCGAFLLLFAKCRLPLGFDFVRAGPAWEAC